MLHIVLVKTLLNKMQVQHVTHHNLRNCKVSFEVSSSFRCNQARLTRPDRTYTFTGTLPGQEVLMQK